MTTLPAVLVTGAQGFLGSELCRQLEAEPVAIRRLDRRAIPSTAETFSADILVPASLDTPFKGVEKVVHAAGLAHVFRPSYSTAASQHEVNTTGTLNVMRAAARGGVRHVVLISSVSVYGGSNGPSSDETRPCNPRGAYAVSKLAAEHYASEIAERSGMTLTILRLATLYGEGDPGNVARLMRAIDRGRFAWVGDGSNLKSLLHLSDAARSCIHALQMADNTTTIYNVTGRVCTMREVVLGLAYALGRPVPRWGVSGTWARRGAKVVDALIGGRQDRLTATVDKWLSDDAYSGDKFRRASGFDARVELSEGLGREVAWYRARSQT